MPRPDQTSEKREQLVPIVARAFAELGYRRTTTAELARRCEVRENILYRLWPDKKAMFVAAIEYVYQVSTQLWQKLLQSDEPGASSAERLLDYEAKHHGELGLHRLIFAGLSETDDPVIHDALQAMYGRFHRFIARQIADHRDDTSAAGRKDAEVTAWAIVGLGTVAAIGRELGLIKATGRKRLVADVGKFLLEGKAR